MAVKDIIIEETNKILGATELLSALSDKAGQYVWKKYKIEQVTITNPSLVFNSNSGRIKVTTANDDIDLSLVNLFFFDGFVSSEPYKFYSQDGQLYYYSTSYPVTGYDAETHELICNAGMTNATHTYTGTKEVPKHTFEGYAVADDESAYPDGGEQDGYWYEVYEEGGILEKYTSFPVVYIEEVTFSSRTQVGISSDTEVTILHSYTGSNSPIVALLVMADESKAQTDDIVFMGYHTHTYKSSIASLNYRGDDYSSIYGIQSMNRTYLKLRSNRKYLAATKYYLILCGYH